jgi:hypothetical protein
MRWAVDKLNTTESILKMVNSICKLEFWPDQVAWEGLQYRIMLFIRPVTWEKGTTGACRKVRQRCKSSHKTILSEFQVYSDSSCILCMNFPCPRNPPSSYNYLYRPPVVEFFGRNCIWNYDYLTNANDTRNKPWTTYNYRTLSSSSDIIICTEHNFNNSIIVCGYVGPPFPNRPRLEGLIWNM